MNPEPYHKFITITLNHCVFVNVPLSDGNNKSAIWFYCKGLRGCFGYNGAMTVLMIGLAGPELTATDIKNLAHPLVGGVIFFKRNFVDYAQLTKLIQAVRQIRGNSFVLAVDQEGGRVLRFSEPFSQLPPLAALGRCFVRDSQLGLRAAYLHAWLMAAELLSVGVDLSFAPVLDVDNGSEVIGDRAFSSCAETVVALAEQYCQGMAAAGMRCVGKHYPGHGSVAADSHFELPIDERSRACVEQLDLAVFEQLFSRKCLDAVMLSHVIYRDFCEQPAGYSSFWQQSMLRQRGGFEGLSISDDLGMEAAKCVGSVEQRYQACVEAGVDLALACDFELCTALLQRLDSAVLSAAAIDDVVSGLRGRFDLASGLTPSVPFWQQQRWQEARAELQSLLRA